MKKMKQTTLNLAKKYGVTLDDLKKFAETYEWSFVSVQHEKRTSRLEPTRDCVIVKSEELSDTTVVEVLHGNCWVCKETCVSYGWAYGGVHTSTCSCGVQDFS